MKIIKISMQQQTITNIFRNKSKSCFLRLFRTPEEMTRGRNSTIGSSYQQSRAHIFSSLSGSIAFMTVLLLCLVPRVTSQDLLRFSHMASQFNYQVIIIIIQLFLFLFSNKMHLLLTINLQ